MARRFILEEKEMESLGNHQYCILGKEVKHMQVLRYQVGDTVTINSDIYRIIKIEAHAMVVEWLQESPTIGIPSIEVTLYMAMLKNDKMDFVVQKAVELGVKRIVPFFSQNVIVKLDEKGKEKRREKLQLIANEACKQCGRSDTVTIDPMISLKEISLEAVDHTIIAYEKDHSSLRSVLCENKEEKSQKIAIIIGAEGGFLPKEIEYIGKQKNVSIVSLGTRILRAETAALQLLSIVMYELDGEEKNEN